MEAKRHTHLNLAHTYWERAIQPGDFAIDATCGNGHDTLKLSELCTGVLALDIQEKAIENTKALLATNSNVHFFLQSHDNFPPLAYEVPVRLVVYNLGYLPGGNKDLTTRVETTLKSLEEARQIIAKGGMISITCYPGHTEGFREQKALLRACSELCPQKWSVCHHEWLNRNLAPSLLILRQNA